MCFWWREGLERCFLNEWVSEWWNISQFTSSNIQTSLLHSQGKINGILRPGRMQPLISKLIINLLRCHGAKSPGQLDPKPFPFTFLPKCSPLQTSRQAPLSGKGAKKEESVSEAWKASESNEKNTSRCTHDSFCSALPVWACARGWKAHSLKPWPLKGMHLGLKCQLGCAPSTGQFFFFPTALFIYFGHDKTQPLPLRSGDGS